MILSPQGREESAEKIYSLRPLTRLRLCGDFFSANRLSHSRGHDGTEELDRAHHLGVGYGADGHLCEEARVLE